MNKEQRRIVNRFRRLVEDARRADLILAVDAHTWSLRFIPREIEREAEDLGCVGEAVRFPDESCDLCAGEAVGVDSACGTPSAGSLPVL
jgi:predicted ATP-grasp superfamily ATP-dependent carboligase